MRVIAIDGPAGAGKSTIARALAARLGLEYLDTGAMYRAVTFAAVRRGIPLEDIDQVGALAREVSMEVGEHGVLVDGVDATTELRSHEITAKVSVVVPDTEFTVLTARPFVSRIEIGEFVLEAVS